MIASTFTTDSHDDFALAVHAGAGPRRLPIRDPGRYHQVLADALAAGALVLESGGAAADAVCAAVTVLEDSELFNAAHGAALTADRRAELDAAFMTGSGESGGVIGSRTIRNPIKAAREVARRTAHVLLIDPPRTVLDSWGIDIADPEYFVTAHRLEELLQVQAATLEPQLHGTVGAVARDLHGELAAATSTGGMTNQQPGRVGDAALIGAGTFADNKTAAISCTGTGEQFIRTVAAHDVHSRLAYLGVDLETAVAGALDAVAAIDGQGGMIAAGRENLVIGFNSTAMFYGYLDNGRPVTHV